MIFSEIFMNTYYFSGILLFVAVAAVRAITTAYFQFVAKVIYSDFDGRAIW